MDRVHIGVLAAGGWALAAALTVGASWSAISVVREAVVPQAAVAGLPAPEEATADASAPAATATQPTASAAGPSAASPSGGSQPAAGRLVLASGRGGTATVRCSDGVPVFVNLVPQQGYTVERDDGSPEVKFRSADHRTEITASCAAGTPRTSVEEKDDGGDTGRGGGNDG